MAAPLGTPAGTVHAQSPADPPEDSRLSAPTITAVYPSDRSMTVTWTPPAEVEDESAVTYEISWLPSDQVDDPDAVWRTYWGIVGWRTEKVIWSNLSNGTEYAVRMRAKADQPGEWTEVVTVEPFERSAEPSGDQPAIPLDVSIGSVLDNTGFDVDLFKIELAERQRVTLRTSGDVRDTVCRLLDSDGTLVPGTKNDDFKLLEIDQRCFVHANLARGTYYFEARGYSVGDRPSSPRNRGRLVVRAAAAPDPGNTPATALPAPRGKFSAGSFASREESHFWRLDLAEGEFIDVPVASPVGDIVVWLRDSSGERLRVYYEAIQSCFIGCVQHGVRMKAELAPGTYWMVIEPRGARAVYAFERLIDHSYPQLLSTCRSMNRSDGIEDELSGCQWHLENRTQRGGIRGEDANVVTAHAAGYLGGGVHVAVVDAGIDLDHVDLAPNADSSRTRSYCGSDTAPFSNQDDHGTAVAGVIAARDNGIGMRGVAPRATLYNRRLLCDRTLDAEIADAMTREMDSICVSNNSWGHKDNHHATPTSYLFDLAIDRGISSGCGGKGIVYVWSAGNGGRVRDDSNLEEFANYYGVTAVCAVNASGVRSLYSEPGANLWVCGPSNDDQIRGHPGAATVTNYDRYRLDFGGTSSAAPVVAGAAALVRAANSELTWRDVKLILAASARQNRPRDSSWREGAVKYGESDERYRHSRQYGFGVVDAHAAAEMAAAWTNVPPMITQTQASDDEAFQIPDASGSITKSVEFDAAIEFVEFVQVNTSFRTEYLRDLRIDLVSPSGTEVLVLPASPSEFDEKTPLKGTFRFGVAGLLGEPAEGTWTLRITDTSPGGQASLNGWGIKLYGHRLRPATPKLTDVVADTTTVTATWTAPEHTGATAITGYELRHATSAATDSPGSGHPSGPVPGTGSDPEWTTVAVPGGAGSLSHTFEVPVPGHYDVQVRAVNGGGSGGWATSLPVTAHNTDPVFAGDPVSLQVNENTESGTAIGEPVSTTDVDNGAELTYTLSDADAAVFAIDSATGQISTSSELDFEVPSDRDGDNVYEVLVSVSDGLDGTGQPDASVDDSIAASIEVLDVDEPPVLAAGDCEFTVSEWASGEWECAIEASDPEGAVVAWSLSGVDAALFEIQDGVLSFVDAVNTTSPSDNDADNVYEVTVEATAGDHTEALDVSLTVFNGNRAPVFNGVSLVLHNAVPGILVSLPVSKADFSDPDGDELVFSLSASRDDTYVAGDLTYSDVVDRIFYSAKTACALMGLDPPRGDAYYTVATLTATDPDGETAQATATFRTDRSGFVCPSLSSAAVDGAALSIVFDGEFGLSYRFVPHIGVFEALAASQFEIRVDGVAVSLADADAISASSDTISLTLAEAVEAGQKVTVSYAPGDYPVAAAFADQPATNNTPVPANRAPVFEGAPPGRIEAPPGMFVSLPVSKADFSDPDGDELVFSLSASRDDTYVAGDLTYSDVVDRIFYSAKTACALMGLDPPRGDAYYTVATLTATDPDGETAQATATFRTDRSGFVCPSLSSAAVDGTTLAVTLDADLAPSSKSVPTAGEFEVKVDGESVSLADSDAMTAIGSTITLSLAEAVEAGQSVTVSYTPGDYPVAAAFADQPATNNTQPEEPDCTSAPEIATMPICAAVSGKELTLTFNRELAAIDEATARSLRWVFLIEGAYHHGSPVTQSPNRVAVDGATLTLTLGTAIRPGDEVTVSYFAAADGSGLQDIDGTAVEDFTSTLTTTSQS